MITETPYTRDCVAALRQVADLLDAGEAVPVRMQIDRPAIPVDGGHIWQTYEPSRSVTLTLEYQVTK